MAYSALADVVVIVHLAFIVFVALGGLLAWRWRRLAWLHVVAVAWAIGSVTWGYDCPLTPLEKRLRRSAGERGYAEGFVDHYIEGVIYPERYTSVVRSAIAGAALVGWAGLALMRRRAPRSAIEGGPGLEPDAEVGVVGHTLDEPMAGSRPQLR